MSSYEIGLIGSVTDLDAIERDGSGCHDPVRRRTKGVA